MNGKLKSVQSIARCINHRDEMILSDPSFATQCNEVNLHWYKLAGDKQNIGDFLSTVVVEYMMDYYHLSDATAASSKPTHLYAIGSIIDGGYQNATVWGSGLLRGKESYWWKHFRKLDIRCVRGPETRYILQKNGYSCPEIYGDPALLMPLIYKPAAIKQHQYKVIPHMTLYREAEDTLSPLTADWKTFISEVAACNMVISSSLHGIILAESYGVPAVLLKPNALNLFKYRDYYCSTGRPSFPIANSVSEALALTPPPLPEITKIQQDLINAFPADLWTLCDKD